MRAILPFQRQLQEIKTTALAEDFDRDDKKDGNVERRSGKEIMLDEITLGLSEVDGVVVIQFAQ